MSAAGWFWSIYCLIGLGGVGYYLGYIKAVWS